MNNYEYCVNWVFSQGASQCRVLDYGCGAGTIVRALRERGVEAFGCDVFYEGGDYSGNVDQSFFSSGIIRRMDVAIPFEANSFDFVVNNQVLEHVKDLDQVLSEISRVLKPGGVVLSMFPDRGVLREGHCGIPFLHWFGKGTRVRVYYAAALRALGLGKHKNGKPIMEWSRDFCVWLDDWTYYRDRGDIRRTYLKYFDSISHIESEYFDQRCDRGNRRLLRAMPGWIKSRLVTRLATMVFLARRRASVT